MNERRKFLVKFSGAAAGLLAAGAATANQSKPVAIDRGKLLTREKLQGRSQFPEAAAENSRGQLVRLYADLIRGKAVVINYMAIGNEQAFPITAKLVEVAHRLGPRLGSEVHFISITSDPVHDTPQRLREFAKRMGVPEKGWQFVRLADDDNLVVSARLYRHPRRPDPHTQLDTVHYGNDAVGVWGQFPSTISTEDAVMRVSSILPGKPVTGPMRQAGPRKLGEPGLPFNNRIA
ncbi:MAG: hypothetical protein KGJ55_09770 [Gammaproteobacteria bacterium]|nr:hypothetical protein [Gammaproteobacteria bacterium]